MTPTCDVESLPFSYLSMNQLTRDLWGSFDARAIAQLAGLALDDCYQMKIYKAPADQQEVLAPYGYTPYGMRITPGSLIFGFYSPCVFNATTPSASVPAAYTVQITDESLDHKWFDDPVSSLFVSNCKPTYQNVFPVGLSMGSFPSLLDAVYPVVGNGLFTVEIQSTSASQQRVELLFGVLEVCR